jgi:hypothetical protein
MKKYDQEIVCLHKNQVEADSYFEIKIGHCSILRRIKNKPWLAFRIKNKHLLALRKNLYDKAL